MDFENTSTTTNIKFHIPDNTKATCEVNPRWLFDLNNLMMHPGRMQ